METVFLLLSLSSIIVMLYALRTFRASGASEVGARASRRRISLHWIGARSGL